MNISEEIQELSDDLEKALRDQAEGEAGLELMIMSLDIQLNGLVKQYKEKQNENI